MTDVVRMNPAQIAALYAQRQGADELLVGQAPDERSLVVVVVSGKGTPRERGRVSIIDDAGAAVTLPEVPPPTRVVGPTAPPALECSDCGQSYSTHPGVCTGCGARDTIYTP